MMAWLLNPYADNGFGDIDADNMYPIQELCSWTCSICDTEFDTYKAYDYHAEWCEKVSGWHGVVDKV